MYSGAYQAIEAGLGERLACPEEVQALVDEGRAGAKSGGGCLDWPVERLAGHDASYALAALLCERAL